MNICLTTENLQSRIVDVLVWPNFLGALEIQQLWWRPVNQICDMVNWFCPKKIRANPHEVSCIFSFPWEFGPSSLLLLGLLHSELSSNAFLLAKLHKLFISIFTSIVIVQVLDLRAAWFFTSAFHSLNFAKTSDSPAWSSPNLPWIIIHECDIIASTTMRFYQCRSPHIEVNVIENYLCVILLFCNLEKELGLLPKYAILAKVHLARFHFFNNFLLCNSSITRSLIWSRRRCHREPSHSPSSPI